MFGNFMIDLSKSIIDLLDKRQHPAIVLARILPRRAGQHPCRSGAIERHVVFLVRIHRQIIRRADRAQIRGCAQPGVLGRVEILPRDVHPRLLGIAADIGPYTVESLAVDIDPRVAGRVRLLAQDVGAVVDAVEVDRLAVIAHPFVRRRGQADHRGQRRPGVDMRHHLVELRAGRDVVRPPHDARHAPAAFERRALLATERRGSRIRIGIQPGAVVGRHDHDRIGCDRPDGVHDLADIGVKLHQRVRVVAQMRPAGEVRRRVGRVVHLEEIHVHEERLGVVRVLLDVVDGVGGLILVEGGKSLEGDLAEVLGRLAGHALPLGQVHVFAEKLGELRVERREPGMEPLARVVVRIGPGIIGGEVLHLVEAMFDRIGFGLVAEMPFAGEVS